MRNSLIKHHNYSSFSFYSHRNQKYSVNRFGQPPFTQYTNTASELCQIKRPRSFLNWAEVKEMAAGGIIFGSHTHKHYPLTELPDAQVSDELQNSMQIMRAHEITPSQVFCYPGGTYNEHSQSLLAKHQIRFALTVNKHPDLDTFPLLLGRISLHEDISNTAALFTSRVWVETVF